MDFFAVPTITFKLLYCLFVIDHGRRRILHFNVTAHPTAEWVCQQLREAFPNESAYKHAILDRNSKFSSEVLTLLKASGITPVRTSIRSPWQNGIAERWVGTARRECFDHVIAINEAHVRRLARVRCLLPRRSHALGTRQGYSCRSRSRVEAGSGDVGIAAADRRFASSIRLENGGVNSPSITIRRDANRHPCVLTRVFDGASKVCGARNSLPSRQTLHEGTHASYISP